MMVIHVERMVEIKTIAAPPQISSISGRVIKLAELS
jgi:hypothetical protein